MPPPLFEKQILESTLTEQSCRVNSVAETQRYASLLGQSSLPGTVIGLIGDLGAGKTHFVQGLAHGLNVHDRTDVVSPTYALMHRYSAHPLDLVHIDFYRLNECDDLLGLGILELLEQKSLRDDCIIAVEWANRIPEAMPADTIWIRLTSVALTSDNYCNEARDITRLTGYSANPPTQQPSKPPSHPATKSLKLKS